MVIDHDPVFCKKPWKCSCGVHNYGTIACIQCGTSEEVVKYQNPREECQFKKKRPQAVDWMVRDNVRY